MTRQEAATLSLTIPQDLDGQRTDKALTTLAAAKLSLSRARLQNLLSEGFIKSNKKTLNDASRKVRAGEVYTITIPPVQRAKPQAQSIKLDIVYEDKDIVVINKPAGLVVHPAPGNHDRTLVNALLAHCGPSLSGIGGVARPGIVHRLDKDTSGLMVVAKNDAAHQALALQFADRSLSRTYHALVWGHPTPSKGEVDAPIGRSPRDRKKMAVTGKGKQSLTYYQVIKSFADVSLVECKLATGRTHQIRVHLAHLRHPVVGDPAYGGKRQGRNTEKLLSGFPRQALHAIELHFKHPRTGKMKIFKSPLPDDMKKLIKALNR